jgi:hypothetical protein
MDNEREIRASDSDRQAVVERLRIALNEGRLNLLEYDNRIALAYQAVTYGDLEGLLVDLPKKGVLAPRPEPVTVVAPAAQPVVDVPSHYKLVPTSLRILWTIWLTAVSINLVVWLMVSISSGEPHYFWPMWVAGPAGAGLFGVTLGVTTVRRGRREAVLRRRQEAAQRRGH